LQLRPKKDLNILWGRRLSPGGRGGIKASELSGFSGDSRQGVEATIDSKRVLLGNLKLMEGKGISLDGLSASAEGLSGEGKTPMFLAANGKAAGIIAVADTLKEDSKESRGGALQDGVGGRHAHRR